MIRVEDTTVDPLLRLQEGVESLLSAFATWFPNENIAWAPADGFRLIVTRAVLRRQLESLQAIVHLVQSGHGFAGAPLLRAACEELVWVKYLATLESRDAEVVLRLIGTMDIARNLSAQSGFMSADATDRLGLRPYVEQFAQIEPNNATLLRQVAMRLGWPKRSEGRLPNVRWLAARVHLQGLYRFLYHGTSRYVHFNVGELMRRAWGGPREVTISSSHFGRYWSAFSLYWGVYLLVETALALGESAFPAGDVPPELQKAVLVAAQRIGEFGMVPLVTAEELAWPFREDA